MASDETSIPLKLAERMAAAGERGADVAQQGLDELRDLRLQLQEWHGETVAHQKRVEPMLSSYEARLKGEHDAKEEALGRKAADVANIDASQTAAKASIAKLWAAILAWLVRMETWLASPRGVVLIVLLGPPMLRQCGVPHDLVQLAGQALSVYAGDMPEIAPESPAGDPKLADSPSPDAPEASSGR